MVLILNVLLFYFIVVCWVLLCGLVDLLYLFRFFLFRLLVGCVLVCLICSFGSNDAFVLFVVCLFCLDCLMGLNVWCRYLLLNLLSIVCVWFSVWYEIWLVVIVVYLLLFICLLRGWLLLVCVLLFNLCCGHLRDALRFAFDLFVCDACFVALCFGVCFAACDVCS